MLNFMVPHTGINAQTDTLYINLTKYAIGDCGRPNQAALCPECQVPIGGASYQLAAGNRSIL
jgi:hypothetical protein